MTNNQSNPANDLPEPEEEDPRLPVPLWKRVLRGLIALATLAGLLYISGIHQATFLRRTPADIEQAPLDSKVSAAPLTVPLTVHILTGPAGSERTTKDIHRLITNANNIWAQADITFQMQNIRHRAVSIRDLSQFEADPHQFIAQSPSRDPETAHLYLTRTLQGVNGLAYGGTNTVSVADYTSSLDFRTLAHEFGHLLGLPHVDNPSRLMATNGAVGVDLTVTEIQTARQLAQRLFRATRQ